MNPPPEAEALLSFWFGPLDAQGRADAEHSARWWKKDSTFDEELRGAFGTLHEAVWHGDRDAWLASARGRLAAVIVLDQLSRNLFRGRPESFAQDARALAITLEGIDRGHDRELAFAERGFLYMPLMHSEDIATQERAVQLFSALRDEVSEDLRGRASYSVEFAEKHRDIVRRFGRFPHRNEVLGRPSTPEEVEFLKQPGSSF